MPRDSGGAYTLPAGNPVVSGTIIASTWANTTMDDLASAMTDSLSRTGNGTMQAPLKLMQGSESNPSLTFGADPLTGRYLAAAGDMRDTVSATDMARYTATAVELNYAGVKQFETTFTGVEVTGKTLVLENAGATTASTLNLRNDEGGVNLLADTGGFKIQQTNNVGTTQDNWITGNIDGAIQLYNNSIIRLQTTSDGAKITGTGGEKLEISDTDSAGAAAQSYISFRDSASTRRGYMGLGSSGDDDMHVVSDNANVVIRPLSGSSELYEAGVKRLETTSTGVFVTGKAIVLSNIGATTAATINLRNDEGGANFLADAAGLKIQQTNTGGTAEDNWVVGAVNGGVTLYYNGASRLLTTNLGITVTGVVNETSDLKLKENLEIIPNALDKVCAINGYTFDMKGEDTPRRTGVVAQEVQAVLPEAVGETADGTLTVAYGNLVGVLIESIKELKAKIEVLEAN